MLTKTRDHFLPPAGLNGAIFFLDDLQNITSAKGLADPGVRFYTKFYLEPFAFEETLECARSLFGLPLDMSQKIAAWLHEEALGHPYFLACSCEYLMATEKQIEPHKLETSWPAILDQLGRKEFRSDVSQLSAKGFDLIDQFARLGEGEVSAKRFSGKFQREYFARLVEKALLIRTGRGRYKLYHHPLFGEFLQQQTQ